MEKIGNVTMNYDYYSGKDLYSDGDIEDTLLEIVKNHERSEYPDIIAASKSWPILYHLSEVRTNILNWYPFEKDATVLEVGAGCGAITGTIAERVKKVTAVDLSKRRSLINAYRNKDRDNLEIIVGNFNDVAAGFTEKFDYVTLIGVLEYGECYIPGENSYQVFLEKIRKLLKPGGKVLIAIENRLGLKYFAGCREDHVGKYFEGIEGYSATSGVKTFSKKQLELLLKQSGYKNSAFYYPYPDYKLPTTIYSDAYLPAKGELANNARNFDADRLVLFDETKAWDTILDAGLFAEFSNSFFVVAENTQKTLFSKSSVERKDAYKIITRIYEEDGIKLVEKRAQGKVARRHVERMAELAKEHPYLTEHVRLVPCEKTEDGCVVFPYIEGVRFDEKIDEEVKAGQWEEVWKDITLLKNIIMQVKDTEAFVSTPEFEQIFRKQEGLEGLAAAKRINMDMVAANIILADEINIIDYEWNFDFAIPLKYILYRSILLNGTLYAYPEEKKQKLMELIEVSEQERETFYRMEEAFQRSITGISLTDLYRQMPTKNIIVSEGNFSQNTYACYAKLRDSERVLYTNQCHLSDQPEMNLELGMYPKQTVEIHPADNPSIVKILELSGVKAGKRESLTFDSNAELVWNDDVFFLEKPVLYVNAADYEQIVFRYRVLRVADPSDNIISVYVHNIRMQ